MNVFRLRKIARLALALFASLSIQLAPSIFQAKADVGLGEEQAEEKLELQKMKTELNDIKSITNDATQELNKINTASLHENAKEFHLICRDNAIEPLPGVKVNCLTYNGRLPGPLIKVKEGDLVRIVLHNQMQVPTSLHFHGMVLPAGVDSLPRKEEGLVRPGDVYTYQFPAPAAGIYWYAPQIVHAEQKTRGLYGPIVVEAKQSESDGAEQEFIIVISDLYAIAGDTASLKKTTAKITDSAGTNGGAKVNANDPQPPSTKSLLAVSPHKFQIYSGEKHIFYLMNGQSAPAIPPLEVSKGQKVKLRLVNAGQSIVPLHLSGHLFEPSLAENGAIHSDTATLMPGSTYTLQFTADNPGVWSLASEVFEQATNGGRFPGGLACVLRYVDQSSK